MKQRIRLTESQLHQLIQDCVNESLRERERRDGRELA